MSTKVPETAERFCCRWPDDFSLFKGMANKAMRAYGKIWFCKHCGQLWVNHRAPGERDAGLTRIIIVEVKT